MSIEGVDKTNKQDLIFASGTALGGGILSGLLGGSSAKLFYNDLPSDVFVNEVRQKIINKTDDKTVRKMNAFEKYSLNIEKANSLDDLVSAEINFKLACSPKTTFNELKTKYAEKLVKSRRFSDFVNASGRTVDIALDVYQDIKDSENIFALKDALVRQKEIFFEGYSLDEIKEMKKDGLARMMLKQGFDIATFDDYAQQAITQSYNIQKGKFHFNPSKISKEMYNIVVDAAKSLKRKTFAFYALTGALISGGGTYSIVKIADLCKKIKKNKTKNNVKNN